MSESPYLELFCDRGGSWRFRLKAANHRKLMTSGESFSSRSEAEQSALRIANWFVAGLYVPIYLKDDDGRRIVS